MSRFADSVMEPVRQTLSGARGAARSIGDNAIGDARFWDQLTHVRGLKRFLSQENLAFKEQDLPNIALGELELLSFHRHGRVPRESEWTLLDAKQNVLSGYLDERLRWRFKLSRLRVYFKTIPILFLTSALLALACGAAHSICGPGNTAHVSLLSYYADAYVYVIGVVLWTLALGGLGACAFLGTTMISETAHMNGVLRSAEDTKAPVETDFDLTDRNLMATRIMIGILFAFLLGTPLAAGSLNFVVEKIQQGNIAKMEINADLVQNMGLTLLPFVIGFSTTLVLGMMDRFVSVIRTGFGMTVK